MAKGLEREMAKIQAVMDELQMQLASEIDLDNGIQQIYERQDSKNKWLVRVTFDPGEPGMFDVEIYLQNPPAEAFVRSIRDRQARNNKV